MANQAVYFGQPRAVHPGVNNSLLQEAPVVADVLEAMANNDTAQVVLNTPGDSGMPPRVIEIYRHTGGDTTSAASATFAINNGEQITFLVDPNNKNDTRAYKTITTTLSGLTNGAATAAQIAASINADPKINGYMHAVAGLTANAFTLFPILSNPVLTASQSYPEGSWAPRFQVIQANALFAFAAGWTSYLSRTYVSQTKGLAGVTGFSYSYVPATRTLTVVNTTGGAINRVCIFVQQ